MSEAHPTSQRDVFAASEADKWFLRNRAALAAEKIGERAATDYLLQEIVDLAPPMQSALEIGAGTGWRLEALRRLYPGAAFTGLEPSREAVAFAESNFPGIRMVQGTADRLPFDSASFDFVMFGFCLCLCDPADLFRVAAEADRVLSEGGHLAIYDFWPKRPYRNPYKHVPGLHTYKMERARMFLWHPGYVCVRHRVAAYPGADASDPDDRVAVAILRRSMAEAFPDRPSPGP